MPPFFALGCGDEDFPLYPGDQIMTPLAAAGPCLWKNPGCVTSVRSPSSAKAAGAVHARIKPKNAMRKKFTCIPCDVSVEYVVIGCYENIKSMWIATRRREESVCLNRFSAL